MNISKHIALAAVKFNNSHNDELLQHIWNNRYSSNFFTVDVVSVARSGASRRMQIHIPFKGRMINITSVVAEVLDNSMKDAAMVVRGGGMDMIFSSLYSFYMSIASAQLKEKAFKFRAVNSYKVV